MGVHVSPILNPPHLPPRPSGSFQCTSPEHPVSCIIETGNSSRCLSPYRAGETYLLKKKLSLYLFISLPQWMWAAFPLTRARTWAVCIWSVAPREAPPPPPPLFGAERYWQFLCTLVGNGRLFSGTRLHLDWNSTCRAPSPTPAPAAPWFLFSPAFHSSCETASLLNLWIGWLSLQLLAELARPWKHTQAAFDDPGGQLP